MTRTFKGIESYEPVSIEIHKCVFAEDENFLDVIICFHINPEKTNLVPLFFNNAFEQFMGMDVSNILDEVMKPFMDERQIEVYITLPDNSSVNAEYNSESHQYTVYVYGVFECTFKDPRALHVFKLKNSERIVNE